MAGDEPLCSVFLDLRTSTNLSIRKLAQISGVSRETIRKYEKGLLIPSNQALQKILSCLEVDAKKARQVQLYVYQARRQRSGSDVRSFGSAAQVELESVFASGEMDEAKAEKLVELFFAEVAPERRTESFSFFLKAKIISILRS